MARRRVRFRPPGVNPGSRIGPLGPFRGRLGLQWVIAPVALGALLVAVAVAALRPHPPGGSFVPVGAATSFPDGTAHRVDVPGNVFVGSVGGQLVAVVQDDGCTLSLCGRRYVDCRGAAYSLDGTRMGARGGLDLLPVQVYRGTVYVDPDHPTARAPGPPPATPTAPCG